MALAFVWFVLMSFCGLAIEMCGARFHGSFVSVVELSEIDGGIH